MNSALAQIDCYIRYISAIWEGPLRITAELIEMVQYVTGNKYFNITRYNSMLNNPWPSTPATPRDCHR
jgi:hypothetical protein